MMNKELYMNVSWMPWTMSDLSQNSFTSMVLEAQAKPLYMVVLYPLFVDKAELYYRWLTLVLLMEGGMTVHSTFGLPMGVLTNDSTSTITMQSTRAQRIREAALIVWDEAPMSPGMQLTVVDRLLRDVMDSQLPFGGKPFLFAGDFRQILPVVRRGTRSDVVKSTIKHNALWPFMQQFRLTRNMRAGGDTAFADWLVQLGNGDLPSVGEIPDCVEIPPRMVCATPVIDFVYPPQISLENIEECARRIILCPRNDDCRRINQTIVTQRVVGQAGLYNAVDTVVADDPDEVANYPVEFLNTLEPDGMPSYRLTLKVGPIVILLRNLDSKRRLCNGTRMVIIQLRRYNFKAKLLSGRQEEVVIPAIPLMTSEDGDLPFRLRRGVQFPVRLSFAMTINKSQGQTFDRVGLLLASPVFTHGQLYVAFSRVRNSDSVKVRLRAGTDVAIHFYVD
ncbi:LOW QUALITY PROTEIN: ATP-dependent DNA helicase pif1-like [Adelges cooleyi]|uniref:LOW QUALITY PROTEIN: ATP-dependent DNA helicase pif1-like n=1 Tax=Adelges cooleyi TaxID=133065 RepID=UPI00218048EB|nr:LOW QUALITY PROTEIN: ATP-dependent DNA helicase pif1-like [Adelges cooleyi]